MSETAAAPTGPRALPEPPRGSFASDDAAGASPEVLAAVAAADDGAVPACGDDPWTRRAEAVVRDLVDAPAEMLLCGGGTGANVVGLASVLQPWQAVRCADSAHLVVDECGAPVRFTGASVVPVSAVDGKLAPEAIDPCLQWRGSEHHTQPSLVSVTQSTEMGTASILDELAARCDHAHANGLLVHLDGARLGNPLAATGSDPPRMVRDAGVRVIVGQHTSASARRSAHVDQRTASSARRPEHVDRSRVDRTRRSLVIHGTCDERFARVREVFESNLAEGRDTGASVAVAVDGELVVDLWGGVADAATGRPWESDTIVCVWSSTKTMAALCVLELADRGELDLHAPVARYWPEFAANGKATVEVRHLLGHTAGLPGWDAPMTLDDVLDVRRAAALLAAQAPWWEPGTAAGYHAITQGHLLGELVLRVTGTSLGEYFRVTFAEPLGADFHIGTPAEHDPRIAVIEPPSGPLGTAALTDDGSLTARALRNPVVEATVAHTQAYRRAELPASNGHGNARSIALVQSIVANGGAVGGRRFLSERGVEALFEVQATGTDLVQGTPTRLGMGFGLNGPEVPVSPNPRACYWGGWGGSIVINDLDARTTFAYAMNRMGDGLATDVRGVSLVLALHAPPT